MNKNLLKKSKQFIKFGIVGLGNNVIFLIVYYMLLYFKVEYLIANISGYVISSLFGFVLNKTWVFNSAKSQTSKSIFRYYLVYATAFLINILCMYLLVDIIKITEVIAPYFVLCITIPYNFILSKVWIYK